MIYEIRTYNLKPGSVPVFEEAFAKGLPAREKYSKLGAFWHTEFGALNQVIHVWPYASVEERADIRAQASKDPDWWRPSVGQYLRDAGLHLQTRLHARGYQPLGRSDSPPGGVLSPSCCNVQRDWRIEQVDSHLALQGPE